MPFLFRLFTLHFPATFRPLLFPALSLETLALTGPIQTDRNQRSSHNHTPIRSFNFQSQLRNGRPLLLSGSMEERRAKRLKTSRSVRIALSTSITLFCLVYVTVLMCLHFHCRIVIVVLLL